MCLRPGLARWLISRVRVDCRPVFLPPSFHWSIIQAVLLMQHRQQNKAILLPHLAMTVIPLFLCRAPAPLPTPSRPPACPPTRRATTPAKAAAAAAAVLSTQAAVVAPVAHRIRPCITSCSFPSTKKKRSNGIEIERKSSRCPVRKPRPPG